MANSIDNVKCLLSVQFFSDCVFPNALAGNQVRESLRTWVTPPDPSTNHTIACGIQHDGSAQWFFRGGIFSEWKSTGSLLWIYGKRMSFPRFSPVYLRPSADDRRSFTFLAGSGKSILWSVVATLCLSETNLRCHVALQSFKTSKPYAKQD